MANESAALWGSTSGREGTSYHSESVRAYFENLLPDSKHIRERIARRFNTGSTEAFELLAEIGRDCVGALEILPEGQISAGTSSLQAEPLSEAQVAQILRGATTPSAMGRDVDGDDFRISIAGAQEKTALLLHNGQWCLPRGSTPTTHLFKLPLGLIGGMKLDMRDSVANEWLCALILKEFGLPVAACQPMQFEDVKVLVVERFDRVWWTPPSGDNRLIRLPQEDLCQATGVPPDAKYEADGGPGSTAFLDAMCH
jgi:serine/threonine-protein kinase HipA